MSKVTLQDFGTGILAGLAANNVHAVSVTGLDRKLVNAYEWIAENSDLDLRFHLSLHEIHGDCPQGRSAIGGAVSRGMGNFDDDHTLYLAVDKTDAHLYLDNLAGGSELWTRAAQMIVEA